MGYTLGGQGISTKDPIPLGPGQELFHSQFWAFELIDSSLLKMVYPVNRVDSVFCNKKSCIFG